MGTPETMEKSNNKNSTQKLLLFYILLLVIVFGALFLFFCRKTGYYHPKRYQNVYQAPTQADETTDWKTYRNDKYGFEVKYPSDWIVGEDTMNDWTDLNVGEGGVLAYGLFFCRERESEGCGWRVYSERSIEDDPIRLFTYTKDQKFNGLPYYYLGKSPLEEHYYFYNESPKNEPVVKEMISTFKFTR